MPAHATSILAALSMAFVVSTSAFAQPVELVRAVQSPYELARYVNTHSVISFEDAWKSFPTPITHPNDCDDFDPSCEAEVIEVQNPPQAIVVIRRDTRPWTDFVRYVRVSGEGDQATWRCGGSVFSLRRNYDPNPRIVYFHEMPFLAFTSQGYSGSGISTALESWIDLSGDDYRPTMGLTTEGSYVSGRDGTNRQFESRVVDFRRTPTPHFVTQRKVTLEAEAGRIAIREGTAVYSWSAAEGRYVFDPNGSTATQAEAETLYELSNDFPLLEEILPLVMPELSEIATGPESPKKKWLREVLDVLDGSPETAALRALLALATKR